MFSRQQKPKPPLRPYDLMHTTIIKSRNFKRWLWVTTILAGVMVGIAWGLSDEWMLRINNVAVAFGLTVVFTLLGFFLLDYFSLTDKEVELREVGIEFLKEKAYDELILEAINTQAAVLGNAGGTRAIIPLLILSLSIPASTISLVVAIMLAGVAIALLWEIYRANIDVIIQCAIAEHRCEQKQKALGLTPLPILPRPETNGSLQQQKMRPQPKQTAPKKKRR